MGRVALRIAWADKESDKSGYWLDLFQHETGLFQGGEREALEWAKKKIDKRLIALKNKGE